MRPHLLTPALLCGMAPDNDNLGPTHITVDGIEGGMARVELVDGTVEDWRLASLPRGVKEGDVVRIHVESGDVDLEIDHAETHRRRNRAQSDLLALNALLSGGTLAQTAPPGVPTIRFLDVRQGDAVLITAPEGQSLRRRRAF